MIYTENPEDPNDIMFNVGVSIYGINTVGGGRLPGEQESQCVVRECAEETRNLINFGPARAMIKQARTFKYEKCIYYLVPGCYMNMMAFCEEYPSVKLSDDPKHPTNEMVEHRMVSANKLIKRFVMGNFYDENEAYAYKTKFINMFMDVGYDRLKNNANNYFVNSINMQANLNVSLAALPKIVSVTLLKNGLPIIYGQLRDNRDDSDDNEDQASDTQPTVYMSSQFYYESHEEIVYRDFILQRGEIVFRHRSS
jgi:8-oxo-dGTP pyrophosphatase MutT (NUDIX family)